MRIGIFGGCFNPPHKMHKNIALELVNNSYLDKVIYVPTGNKYNKTDLISDIDRFNMLKLMCQNNANLDVSDYEFKTTLTYTYQTLDYFKSINPNDDIYFICGADNLKQIDTWREYQYILKNYKIIAINRNNIDLTSLINKYDEYKENIIIANIKTEDLSSTKIRSILKEAPLEEILNYIDEEVYKYIKNKSELYKK